MVPIHTLSLKQWAGENNMYVMLRMMYQVKESDSD